MAKYGTFTDYSGATRRVEIVAETKDGRLLIKHPTFRDYGGGYLLVKKEEVKGWTSPTWEGKEVLTGEDWKE